MCLGVQVAGRSEARGTQKAKPPDLHEVYNDRSVSLPCLISHKALTPGGVGCALKRFWTVFLSGKAPLFISQ